MNKYTTIEESQEINEVKKILSSQHPILDSANMEEIPKILI